MKEVKMVAANKVKSHMIKETELDLVHVSVQKPGFNGATGKPIFKPFTQIYNPREYHQFVGQPEGMKIAKELHVPKGVRNQKEQLKWLADIEAKRQSKLKKGNAGKS